MEPIKLLRQRLATRTQAALADELGISPQYLSDILNERREPGAKVLDALGITRISKYVRKSK